VTGQTLWSRLTSLWGTASAHTLDSTLNGRLQAWEKLALPSLAQPVQQIDWVIVDSETTGLSLQNDQLIALGAVRVRGGVIHLRERFECVLRQDEASERDNIVIHGIGGDEQCAGSNPAEALMDWLEFAGRSPLVAFHAEFDAHFLKRACKRYMGIDYRPVWVDLAELVRVPYRLPLSIRGTAEGTLDHWLDRLSIPVFQRHRAIADAMAEAQLFLALLAQLEPRVLASGERLQGLADFNLAREARRLQGLS
jgi:DNA polymerase III subunit epsilon